MRRTKFDRFLDILGVTKDEENRREVTRGIWHYVICSSPAWLLLAGVHWLFMLTLLVTAGPIFIGLDKYRVRGFRKFKSHYNFKQRRFLRIKTNLLKFALYLDRKLEERVLRPRENGALSNGWQAPVGYFFPLLIGGLSGYRSVSSW